MTPAALKLSEESAVLMQADMLFRVERFRDAENVLRRWLISTGSQSASVQAVLSQAISHQPGRYLEAISEARRAIAQDPAAPIGYYVLALIQADGDPKGALLTLEDALRCGPDRPAFYALQARIYLKIKQPKRALESIEIARRLSPENVQCIQIHAVALLHSGKARQAQEVIDTGLRLDPEDATVHNALGWTLLRLGETDMARMHFCEALRMKPNMGNAREGLLHALKARYPFYKWIFGYFQWQQEQPRPIRLFLILCSSILTIIVIASLMFAFALINVDLIWILTPLLILLSIAMVAPPLAMPLFDLFLRFDPYGHLSLTNERLWLTNWIIAIFLCTVIAVVELFISHSGLDSLGIYIISFLIAGFLIGWWPSRKRYGK